MAYQPVQYLITTVKWYVCARDTVLRIQKAEIRLKPEIGRHMALAPRRVYKPTALPVAPIWSGWLPWVPHALVWARGAI